MSLDGALPLHWEVLMMVVMHSRLRLRSAQRLYRARAWSAKEPCSGRL